MKKLTKEEKAEVEYFQDKMRSVGFVAAAAIIEPQEELSQYHAFRRQVAHISHTRTRRRGKATYQCEGQSLRTQGIEGKVMNDTDLQIIEMYYEDGMKEAEIAESLNLSELMVHEVLAAFEESDNLDLFEGE